MSRKVAGSKIGSAAVLIGKAVCYLQRMNCKYHYMTHRNSVFYTWQKLLAEIES